MSLATARKIVAYKRDRVHQTVGRSNLLYGYETRPVQVANDKVLTVFDNDSICHVWHMRCRDYVSSTVFA